MNNLYVVWCNVRDEETAIVEMVWSNAREEAMKKFCKRQGIDSSARIHCVTADEYISVVREKA